MIKKYLHRVFIDGLSGMAMGLFATLIVGTIIQQIGTLIGGQIGDLIFLVGKVAAAATCAGIGVGVAHKFQESSLVVLSAATCGMIGGYASKLLAGTVFSDGSIILAGPGEPLGAFIAAYVGIEVGHLIAGKTKIDILLTPLVTIGTGSAVGILVGPPISSFMTWLGSLINWGTEQRAFPYGNRGSRPDGNDPHTAYQFSRPWRNPESLRSCHWSCHRGCCCNMIGFAVASYRENKLGGLLAQGIGTSMLQVPNIMRKPVIWLPAILSSAILGPVSTMLFHMTSNATGSGMGTAGFVGQIMTWQVMTATESPVAVMIKIILIQFLLPGLLALGISEFMRKHNFIKTGDMKLDI